MSWLLQPLYHCLFQSTLPEIMYSMFPFQRNGRLLIYVNSLDHLVSFFRRKYDFSGFIRKNVDENPTNISH